MAGLKQGAGAALGALGGYLLYGFLITRIVDLTLLTPALAAALVLGAVSLLLHVVVKGRSRLTALSSSLIALVAPCTAAVLLLVNELGEDRAGNSPEVQATLGSLGAGLGRGFLGVAGLMIGCLLAGTVAATISYRASRGNTETTPSLGRSLVVGLLWAALSAVGAYIYYMLVG